MSQPILRWIIRVNWDHRIFGSATKVGASSLSKAAKDAQTSKIRLWNMPKQWPQAFPPPPCWLWQNDANAHQTSQEWQKRMPKSKSSNPDVTKSNYPCWGIPQWKGLSLGSGCDLPDKIKHLFWRDSNNVAFCLHCWPQLRRVSCSSVQGNRTVMKCNELVSYISSYLQVSHGLMV